MNFYFYTDYILQSSVTVSELPIATTPQISEPRFSFQKLDFVPPELNNTEYADHTKAESCQPYPKLTTSGYKYLMHFCGHADFLISNDGCQISGWPHQGTPDETITHLLLDHVLPRLHDLQRQLLIHASSVRVSNRAIAFIGESGAGKSTLSTSFHVNGHTLLSDDGLLIKQVDNRVSVIPTYRSLRLWSDSLSHVYKENPVVSRVTHDSDKLRVVSDCSGEGMMEDSALAIIYLLTPTDDENSDSVSITQLRPIDACMAIISNSFQFDVDNKKRTAERLKQAAQLCRAVPVFRLQYQRDFTQLPAVRAAILKHHEQTLTSPEMNLTTSSLTL